MPATLCTIFTPLIAYTLLYARTPEEQQRPFGEIRAQVEALLQQSREAAKRNEISQPDYENGCFTIVAWLDEVVLYHAAESNPPLFDQWRRPTLQVALFNTGNAGEEFFERLSNLKPFQKELYEVYYLVLCLGFRGRYYDESQQGQLIEFRRQCAAHLPLMPIDLAEFEKHSDHITPQPYDAMAPIPRAVRRRPRSFYWLALPMAAIAAALIFYSFRRVDPDLHALDEVIRSLNCAEVTVTDIQNGVVRLGGHVASDEQRMELREKVSGVRGVRAVGLANVTIMEKPFCEMVELLKPLREQNVKDGSQIELRPAKGCEEIYHLGERLTPVHLESSKPLDNVYIDYFAADREYVSHVFPNLQEPIGDLKDARALTVGSGDNSKFKITPPFGRELITAISSPKPLFESPHLRPEAAEPYVASLREALGGGARNPGLAANYCFTTSAP